MLFRYLIVSLEYVVVVGTNDIDVANAYVEFGPDYVIIDAQDATFTDLAGEKVKIKEEV